MKVPEIYHKKKILIVDDANSVRMLARAMLIDAGFKYVAQAKDGQDAIDFLNKRHVDLVICDWNMPVMSGLELFEKIQLDPALNKAAFIMLTSSSEHEKVSEAVSTGITNYILKPFNADILLKNAVKVLQKQE